MTITAVPQPDLERWVWQNVSGPGVTSFCYAAEHQWPPWLVAYSVQIDARARTKKLARDLAERIRQTIVELPNRRWNDGVISYTQPIEGPFWLPDDEGEPRYCARYEIRAHPNRSGLALPHNAQASSSPARRKGTE